VVVAEGFGSSPSKMPPALEADVRRIYADGKQCIWAELDADFITRVPNATRLSTQSADRTDYILHPTTGEVLKPASVDEIRAMRRRHAGAYNVQIVVSDGLNALAIMDQGHLPAFLERLRDGLRRSGFRAARELFVLTSGRVRAGYRIGETLFGDLPGNRVIVHVIGERPGTGHHTFSVYMTSAPGSVWGRTNVVDHNITKVVSGIATTALDPSLGADESVRILNSLS
jgi:ethanolamine ammonia-lyase large subunit